MNPLYLMLIVMNAQTGEEISRSIESGPFPTVEACVLEQRKNEKAEHIVLTTNPPQARVHECAFSSVDKPA